MPVTELMSPSVFGSVSWLCRHFVCFTLKWQHLLFVYSSCSFILVDIIIRYPSSLALLTGDCIAYHCLLGMNSSTELVTLSLLFSIISSTNRSTLCWCSTWSPFSTWNLLLLSCLFLCSTWNEFATYLIQMFYLWINLSRVISYSVTFLTPGTVSLLHFISRGEIE